MQKIALLFAFTLCLYFHPLLSRDHPPDISGIYPHLAFYNDESECGTGAVVPWAGRLWVVTYGPHLPRGSSDKLYEITPDLQQIIRPESTGGTPANRMVHRESAQLFIGPYVIDACGNVRVIPYAEAPGRYTGMARHLTDPAQRIYIATMEEGFYDVDVTTLETTVLYRDLNVAADGPSQNAPGPAHLPGAHGKGLYSGQGVLVYSNNGEQGESAKKRFDIEAGVLAEWDGKKWTAVRRNQFVEVTGPGGIYGNPDPQTGPLWATGWDHKSLLLGCRDNAAWHFYRLPKAGHSYDGAHGWNTEWPRIRDIGTKTQPDYLMTMHGMFWRFPQHFCSENTAGIRPRSAYLKVIGDFARWNGRIVFGCDDSAQKEFLNKRKVKGEIQGPGQSNSNLWFCPPEKLDRLGPCTAAGAVWLTESVEKNRPSEPFLFAGWPKRCAWLKNHGTNPVNIIFEIDKQGSGNWTALRTVSLDPGEAKYVSFPRGHLAEWIRVKSDQKTKATVHFNYTGTDDAKSTPDAMFAGLVRAGSPRVTGGLLYGLGDNRRALGISARDNAQDAGYYELDQDMQLVPKNDGEMQRFIDQTFAIPQNVLTVESASVLIVDDSDRRWRLPLGDDHFSELIETNQMRLCREVATERDLFNCHGTFYELPAENAGGFAKIRPVASHDFCIHDYASYRGMLMMTGVDPAAGENNPHVFVSKDKKAAVWAGAIDDLWRMGKPRGRGGPWKDTRIEAGQISDPYLIGFYDRKSVSLSHDQNSKVTFVLQVDPSGHGPWMDYLQVTIPPGEKTGHVFPEKFQARWIRIRSEKSCTATAWFIYE